MGASTDDLKGRAKEAAGAVTGDERLKREGKADQAVAKIKGGVDDAAEKVEEGLAASEGCQRIVLLLIQRLAVLLQRVVEAGSVVSGQVYSRGRRVQPALGHHGDLGDQPVL